jgi:hypothetical protein
MMTVRRSKKLNAINVINLQKWYSLFSKACHYVALFQEFVDTPVNGRPSLFGIDSVHQIETSLSHALLVYVNICVGLQFGCFHEALTITS